MESIVINFDANTQELTKAIDILEKMGLVAKKDADAFRALNSSSNAFAQGQNTVQKELTETEKLLASISLQGQKTNAILENAGKKSGFGNVKKDIGVLDTAIGKVGATIGAAFAVQQLVAFGKEAINLSAQFNSIRNALNFVQGSAEKGGQAMEFLRDLSERLGLELVSTAGAFKLFSASAQLGGITAEETQKIFTSVAEATTALGLSADDTQGVFLALSQIISKGTVQAEELRGQIGERLPGAFELAAKSMGVTTQELNKLLQQGKVLAKDFLPGFAATLKETFSDALPEAVNGSRANLNRLSNLFTEFKVSVGDSLNSVIGGIFALKDAFSDGITDSSVTSGLEQERIAFGALGLELLSLNEGTKERSLLIDKLEKQYPGFIGHINGEEKSNKDLAAAIDLVNQAYLDKIFISIKQQEVDAQATKVAELRLKRGNAELEIQKIAVKLGLEELVRGKNIVEQLGAVNDLIEVRKKQIAEISSSGRLTASSETAIANRDLLKLIELRNTIAAINKDFKPEEDKAKELFENLEKEKADFKKKFETDPVVVGVSTTEAVKSIESLQKLIDDLTTQRKPINVLAPANPRGNTDFDKLSGQQQFDDLTKRINKAKAELDALTGKADKAAETAASKAAAALKKRLEEEARIRKEFVDKEFAADEENLEIDLARRIAAVNTAEREESITHEQAVLFRANLDYNATTQRIQNAKDYNKEIGDLLLKQQDNLEAIEKAKTAIIVAEQKKREEDFDRRKKDIEDFYDVQNRRISENINIEVDANILSTESYINELKEKRRAFDEINKDLLNDIRTRVEIEKTDSAESQKLWEDYLIKLKAVEDEQERLSKVNVIDLTSQKTVVDDQIETTKNVLNVTQAFYKESLNKLKNATGAEKAELEKNSQFHLENIEKLNKNIDELTLQSSNLQIQIDDATTQEKLKNLETQKEAAEKALKENGARVQKEVDDAVAANAEKDKNYRQYLADRSKLNKEISDQERNLLTFIDQKKTGKSNNQVALETSIRLEKEYQDELDHTIKAIEDCSIEDDDRAKNIIANSLERIKFEKDFQAALDETIKKEDFKKLIDAFDSIASEFQNLISGISRIYNNYFDGLNQKIDENLQKQLDSFDEQAEANEELHSKNKKGDREYEQSKKFIEAQRKAAEEKADRESRKLKHDQAILNKELAYAAAVINTAVGVTAALKEGEIGIALAVIIGAAGAAEIVAISQTPIPELAQGTERVTGKGTETSDEVPAKLSVGERVVRASTNKKFFPILSAIHHERLDAESLNAISKFTPETIKAIAKTDPQLIKDLATMQPVFMKHFSNSSFKTIEGLKLNMVPIKFREELVTVMKETHDNKNTEKMVQQERSSSLNEYDIKRALESGANIKNAKEIAKEVGKEIANTLNNEYSIRRRI